MEQIKSEFESYLKGLVAHYKDDQDLSDDEVGGAIGGTSRNYNAEANDKMYELISRDRSISAMAMKLELAKLRVKYHRVLIEDYR